MEKTEQRIIDEAKSTGIDNLIDLSKHMNLDKKGGSGHNGGMTPWETSVESRLSQFHIDIQNLGAKIDRQLFFIIAGFCSVLGVMAKGFGWI